MTPVEKQLLYILIEECSEITKACTKALRFGLDDEHEDPSLPAWGKTPRQEIRAEWNDVMGTFLLMQRLEIVPLTSKDDVLASEAKIEKIQKMLEYSRTHGELT